VALPHTPFETTESPPDRRMLLERTGGMLGLAKSSVRKRQPHFREIEKTRSLRGVGNAPRQLQRLCGVIETVVLLGHRGEASLLHGAARESPNVAMVGPFQFY
jgi:hypothetical protein